jgi:hypothetical protein
MDDEQFNLWKAFYCEGLEEIKNYEQSPQDYVHNAIFEHYLL